MFCGYKGSTKKEMNMTKVILKKIRKEMPVILPPGAKGEIAKALGCGRVTVWAALVNNRRGPVADRIREYVLEKYGREVVEKEVNND